MRISTVDDCAENDALCAVIDLSLVGVRKGDIETWPDADDDEIITVALLVTEQIGDQAPYEGGFAEDIDDDAIIAMIESWRAAHPEHTGKVYVIGVALDDAGALPVPAPAAPPAVATPAVTIAAPAKPALPERIAEIVSRGLAAAKADDLPTWYVAFRDLRDGVDAPWRYAGATETFRAHAERAVYLPPKGGIVEKNTGGDIVYKWVDAEPSAPIPEPDDEHERKYLLNGGSADGEYRRLKTALPLARAYAEGLTRLLEAPESLKFWDLLTFEEQYIHGDGITREMSGRWPRMTERGRRWKPSERLRAAWNAYSGGA